MIKSLAFLLLAATVLAEPEPTAVADPSAEAKADPEADPYLLYGGYYGHGLGYARYGYGYPYSYGHLGYWGRKRRSAEAEPAADPKADPEADPYLLYGGYYGHGLGYA